MWFVKVILLGDPRLGKTTACRRLTGEISDTSSSGEVEEPSTGTVESGHGVFIRSITSTTALVTPSEWLATRDLTDEACMFLQFFYSHTENKTTVIPDSKGEFVIADSNEQKPAEDEMAEISSHFKKEEELTSVESKPSVSSSSENSSSSTSHGLSPEVADLFREAVGPKY